MNIINLFTSTIITICIFPQIVNSQPLVFTVKNVVDNQVIQQPLGTDWDMRKILTQSEWIFDQNGTVSFTKSRNGFSKPMSIYYGRYNRLDNIIYFRGCNIDPDCQKTGDIISGYYSRFEGTVNLNMTPPVMIIEWTDFKNHAVVEKYKLRMLMDN